jgi:hypothetical protein
MQAFADMGNSFGMGMPTNVIEGMPTAKTDASGVSGYSSYPAYKEAAAKAAMESPEAAKRYADFFDMSPMALFGTGNTVVPTSSSSGGGGSSSSNKPKSGSNPLTMMAGKGPSSGGFLA